jgi:hypothetical protein
MDTGTCSLRLSVLCPGQRVEQVRDKPETSLNFIFRYQKLLPMHYKVTAP